MRLLDESELEQLFTKLSNAALPMLLGNAPHLGCTWQLVSGDQSKPSAGYVYRATIPTYGHIYKLSILVAGLTCEEVFDELYKASNCPMGSPEPPWLPNCVEATMLDTGRLNDAVTIHVSHQRAKGVPGISDRDFVSIFFNSRLSNGVMYSLNCCAPKYDHIPAAKCIRAENNFGAFLFEPAANGCLFTYLYNTDLKGMLPKSLVNMTLPWYLLRLGRALQDRASIVAASKGELQQQAKVTAEI